MDLVIGIWILAGQQAVGEQENDGWSYQFGRPVWPEVLEKA
jgi:hypothetical protein